MRKPTNKLEKHVAAWLKREGKEYPDKEQGVLDGLVYGGCASGMVTHLVYYTDTTEFYKHYQAEIIEVLYNVLKGRRLSIAGLLGNGWDRDDPLAMDVYNQNVIVWFVFEEVARRLMEE